MRLINKYIFIFAAVCLFFSSCREQQWDEHNKLTNSVVGETLLEAILNHPDGSKFYEAAIKAGYGELLEQATNYTVFVPKNDAWQTVDMNNVESLKAFVSYHIAYGKFLSSQPELHNNTLRMLNTKLVKYDEGTQSFKGAKIVSADNVAGNGVFHVIDQLMDLNNNVWEIIFEMTNLDHVQFLRNLDHYEMDMERSFQTGVNVIGRPVYDTAWVKINNFLKIAPLNNEDSTFTYIVLKDEGFDMLFKKYRKYFTYDTEEATDSLAKINVSQDFIFRGIVDITQHDTLTNVFGVKVPLKNAVIESVHDASNGRVYVIDQSNILLKEKFKPVLIEGEDYNRSAGNNFVYVRYKLWASGTKDIMLSCSTSQRDDIEDPEEESGWRRYNSTFQWDTNNRSNMNNFWIEYKAPVFAVDYEIHYVAYNDIDGHYSNPEHTLRIVQKLFISMPGEPTLRKDGDRILNNYLHDICFVSVDTAGIHKERKMTQWNFNNEPSATINTQFILEPVNEPDATLLKVKRTGELTLWLCNTTGSTVHNQTNAPSAQGMLFLDYIKLVPILEEP